MKRRNTSSYNKVVARRSVDKERFGGNREKCLIRDGYKCVQCGMTNEEHIKKFGWHITVDHIDGFGTYKPKHLRNNKLSNLQTLCTPCHVKKDHKMRTPPTHCKRGHPRTPENLIFDRVGYGRCKICLKVYQVLYVRNKHSNFRQMKKIPSWMVKESFTHVM